MSLIVLTKKDRSSLLSLGWDAITVSFWGRGVTRGTGCGTCWLMKLDGG